MNKQSIQEFCTGCKLCAEVINTIQFCKNDGFSYPSITEEEVKICKNLCPFFDDTRIECEPKDFWGGFLRVYKGWSRDTQIREKASSGGIITQLGIFLLEKGYVNGIFQVKQDKEVKYHTANVISRSREDVIECMGSRYSVSSPLEHLFERINTNEKYAFIGKPCDIKALRKLQEQNTEIKKVFPVTLSFFCAGMPSESAQRDLLEIMKPKDNKANLINLQYRGNGWPGMTCARYDNGEECKLEYISSWGNILGRKVRKCCRFCLDGIGEYADISCGDLWELNDDNTPDFSEKPGQNIVFARTETGEKILSEAELEKYIYLEDYKDDLNKLKHIQPYQFQRRGCMHDMLYAMKIMGKSIPEYNKRKLLFLRTQVPKKTRINRFVGTIKRCISGKI